MSDEQLAETCNCDDKAFCPVCAPRKLQLCPRDPATGNWILPEPTPRYQVEEEKQKLRDLLRSGSSVIVDRAEHEALLAEVERLRSIEAGLVAQVEKVLETVGKADVIDGHDACCKAIGFYPLIGDISKCNCRSGKIRAALDPTPNKGTTI